MNWAQFNDPLSHTCLADVVLASWSLTQEVAGLIPFKNKYILSLNTTCLFAQIFSCIFLFIISLLVIYFIDKFIEQECIPVGCVPSAWDAPPGGGPVDPLECGPGDPPGVGLETPPQPHPSTSPPDVSLKTCKACWDTTPPRWQTDTCKNITFANFACGR